MKSCQKPVYLMVLTVSFGNSAIAMDSKENSGSIFSFLPSFSYFSPFQKEKKESSTLQKQKSTEINLIEAKEERKLFRKEENAYKERQKLLIKKDTSEEFSAELTIKMPTHHSALTPLNVKNIVKSLSFIVNLSSLDLRNTGLTDETALLLADMLKTNTSLKALSLFVNKIGNVGIGQLMEAMTENKTLTWLNVGANSFTDEGAGYIAKMLDSNITLKSLGLNFLNLTDEGATVIANSLKTNKTLTYIDLSEFIHVTTQGFSKLCEAVKINTSLTTVRFNS